MAISHCYWYLVGKNSNLTLLLTSSHQEWQFHIATDIQWSRMAISHCYWYLVVKNSNFTLLLSSSVQEWQFHIPTDLSWWRMTISHCYWHLVVMNGNFTLLLTSSGEDWQFYIATDMQWSRMAISHFYWHLMIKNGNFTFLLTLLLKCQPWGLIFSLCIMWYCCWSSFGRSCLQIYPHNLSDEVTKIRCEMKYPDRLSDIHPPELVRWSDKDEMWDEVPR